MTRAVGKGRPRKAPVNHVGTLMAKGLEIKTKVRTVINTACTSLIPISQIQSALKPKVFED